MSLPRGITRGGIDLLHKMIDVGGIYISECNRADRLQIKRLWNECYVSLDDPSHWEFAWPTLRGRRFAEENP